MTQKLIIFGSGKHALIVLNEVIKNYNFKEIVFFDNITRKKSLIYKKKKFLILKKFSSANNFINKKTFYFIGVGSNLIRKKIYLEIKKKLKKCKTLTIINKNSFLDEDVKIGNGSIILSGVSINFNTKIGNFCIINTNSSIDHDNIFGHFSSAGPGVNTGGSVKVGTISHLGIGSSIKDKISIGSNTIIGGGAFVNKNCKGNSTYLGVPAKQITK